jgi:NAD(P)-dependent dehydrogenase (short-subunit alcohol dehydrogenase family)
MENENRPGYVGKVAFVTGAANGIGRATALAFAREGAKVVLADISEHGNQETDRMLQAPGAETLAIRCDVTRSEEVKAALKKTIDVRSVQASVRGSADRRQRLAPMSRARAAAGASTRSVAAPSRAAVRCSLRH